MSYRDVYEKWLSSSALSEAEKEELRSISGDEKEIESRFFAPLEFGTAGLRGIMAVGLLIFEFGTDFLLGLFNASENMYAMGRPAFRIIALSFLPAAVGIVMSSVFQALGEGLISLVMSALRQMVFLLPLAWALARFVGLEAVWYSLPIAEVVGFVLALVFYRHIYNHKIAHIETVKFD